MRLKGVVVTIYQGYSFYATPDFLMDSNSSALNCLPNKYTKNSFVVITGNSVRNPVESERDSGRKVNGIPVRR